MTDKQSIALEQALRILGDTKYSEAARNDMLFGLTKLAITLDADSMDLARVWRTSCELLRESI